MLVWKQNLKPACLASIQHEEIHVAIGIFLMWLSALYKAVVYKDLKCCKEHRTVLD